MNNQREDKELLLLIKSDDFDAFERIYKRYAGKLYSFALRLLKNHTESEEIVQDTFLKVWERRSTIDENQVFSTFLLAIAKYRIYNFFRHQAVRYKYDSTLPKDIELSEDESDEHLEDLKELVGNKIAQLPDRQREVISLKLEGYSNEEIAATLELSKKTVENHLNRAYGQLRNELGDWKSLLPLLIFLYLNIF